MPCIPDTICRCLRSRPSQIGFVSATNYKDYSGNYSGREHQAILSSCLWHKCSQAGNRNDCTQSHLIFESSYSESTDPKISALRLATFWSRSTQCIFMASSVRIAGKWKELISKDRTCRRVVDLKGARHFFVMHFAKLMKARPYKLSRSTWSGTSDLRGCRWRLWTGTDEYRSRRWGLRRFVWSTMDPVAIIRPRKGTWRLT